MLTCFKKYKWCIHILYHILDSGPQNKTKIHNGATLHVVCPILSIPWLLKWPGHKQGWYWLNKLNIPYQSSEALRNHSKLYELLSEWIRIVDLPLITWTAILIINNPWYSRMGSWRPYLSPAWSTDISWIRYHQFRFKSSPWCVKKCVCGPEDLAEILTVKHIHNQPRGDRLIKAQQAGFHGLGLD